MLKRSLFRLKTQLKNSLKNTSTKMVKRAGSISSRTIEFYVALTVHMTAEYHKKLLIREWIFAISLPLIYGGFCRKNCLPSEDISISKISIPQRTK